MGYLGGLAVAVNEVDVGDMDSGFLFDDTALGSLGIGFGMLGYHVHTLNEDAVFVTQHLEDLSGLALVVTGIHDDGIAFLDIELFHNAQSLEYLGGQGNDFHIILAEFAGHRAEDTGSAEFAGAVQENASILVETDIAAVRTTDFLLGAHHHGLGHGALLDVTTRDGTLYSNDDGLADGSITVTGTAQHTDAEDFLSTAVVGNR